MDNMKKIQYLSMLSLVFIICSGVYGVMIGIHYTNEYYRLTEELRNQAGVTITAGSLIFNYFLGAFRGIITIACGVIGMINIRKKEVKTGHLIFLGIVTLLYILGLKEFPYGEEFVQMLIAIFCFGMLSIYKFKKYHKEEENGFIWEKG